jgi:uncharacterized membrane protein YdbT with pleckstrin-like domain
MEIGKNILSADEKVIRSVRMHWIVFVKPILCLMIIGVPLDNIINHGPIFKVIFLIWIIACLLRYEVFCCVVTDKRIIFRNGVFNRVVSDIKIDKAESITSQESFLGRLLGYGTIRISTSGNAQCYRYVDKPAMIRSAINEVNAEREKS